MKRVLAAILTAILCAIGTVLAVCPGDLTGDCYVDFEDFAILASHWRQTCSEPNYCECADYYHDGQVDSNDLSYLSEKWLEEISPVLGKDAIIVPRGSGIAVEIEGSAGRISVPVDLSQSLIGLSGLAAEGDTVYALTSSNSYFPPPYGTTTQQLLTFNLKTRLLTQTVNIALLSNEPGLCDIAVLNGNVYGSWVDRPGDIVKIRKIETNGTLTDVFSQQRPEGMNPYYWPLIAASTKTNFAILALMSSTWLPSYSYCVVDTTTWSVSNQISGSAPAPYNIIMRNDGQHFVVDTTMPPFFSQSQDILSTPDFAVTGNLYHPYTLGNTSISYSTSRKFTSDEFHFAYDSSLPAVATLASGFEHF